MAALRRVNGLTQPALSALTGYSVTTIGHAETVRLWQSRDFWETTDGVLAADGALTRLYDAYRAEAGGLAEVPERPAARAPDVPGPAALTRMTLYWSDGTASTVYTSSFPVL